MSDRNTGFGFLRTALGAGLAILALSPWAAASACSCMPLTRTQAIERTPFVFEGKAVSSRVEGGAAFTVFEVLRPIKGALPTRVEVSSRVSPAACGVTFATGETATVGASLREHQFHTNSCLIFALGRRGR